MGIPLASEPQKGSYIDSQVIRYRADDRADLAKPLDRPNRAARGMLTGIALGTMCWGAILVFAGVIKL